MRDNVAKGYSWRAGGWTAKHCLSKPSKPPCALYVNWVILVAFVICSLIKLSGMLYVAIWMVNAPLMTTGDAIQSFLINPDVSTRQRCLTKSEDVLDRKWWIQTVKLPATQPKHFDISRRRWMTAASKTRWMVFVLL